MRVKWWIVGGMVVFTILLSLSVPAWALAQTPSPRPPATTPGDTPTPLWAIATPQAKAYSERGLAYYKLGDYERALADLNQAIALDPKDATAYANRALVYEQQFDYPQALADCDQALALDPQHAPAYFVRGRIYSRQSDFEKALADVNKGIELAPNDAAAYYSRGVLHVNQGDYPQALADADKALALDPQYAGAYQVRGSAYESQGDYPQALVALNQALALDPQYARAYYVRGIVYEDQGDYPRALVDYDKAIALAPMYKNVYVDRCNVYRKTGNYPQALADCGQAIALDPKFAAAYNTRGLVYYNQRDYPHALDEYKKAIELDSKFEEPYLNRGNIYYNRGDYQDALPDYTKAIELNPKDQAAWSNRGGTYLSLKDYPQALADFNKAIELDPKDAQAYYYRAKTYSNQGDLQRAMADLNQAIALDPKSADAYRDRGWVYSDLGDAKQALADFDQAIVLNPQSAVLYSERAAFYGKQGDFKRALTDGDKAVALDPKSAGAYYIRGLVHEFLGEVKLALADYDQAIALEPNKANPAYEGRAKLLQAAGKAATPTPGAGLKPAPTTAATPALTPAAAAGAPVFRDDFSGEGGYLGTYQADDGQSQYAGGVYQMAVTKKGTYIYGLTAEQDPGSGPKLTIKGPLPENVSIEVDATFAGEFSEGRFGIGVGSHGGLDAYALLIDGNGRSYTISKIDSLTAAQAKDPSDTAMFSWLAGQPWGAPHPAIHTGVGATNHLRVDWAPDGLTLYVNGQKLAEYPLEKPVTGGIGLYANATGQTPFEVDFDNLVVRGLPARPASAAAAPQSEQVFYEDDFSDPQSGWFTGSDGSATMAYQGGAYHITIPVGINSWIASPVDAFRDASAEVTITHLKGQQYDYAGLIIRRVGDVHYAFDISWDGQYTIGKQPVDGDFVTLVDWTQSAAIKTGDKAKNTVRADFIGDTLTFYVNGQQVDQVQDADIAAGSVGLEVGNSKKATTTTEFAFNNLVLRQP